MYLLQKCTKAEYKNASVAQAIDIKYITNPSTIPIKYFTSMFLILHLCFCKAFDISGFVRY